MKKMVLIDDLDGSEATETVKFGIDGDLYEVDLSSGNAETLRSMLAPYRTVARATRLRNGRKPTTTPAKSPTRTRNVKRRKSGTVPDSAIREWATSAGIEVKPIGRVPKALREQYAEANS